MDAFVSIVELHLHYGESQDLKGKRKELQSLKEQLRHRFGASVAETDYQDLWQRSTVSAAVSSCRLARWRIWSS